MNYYEHHLGDYDAATAHLTWIEDMAYARLIRLYYRRERPIPNDISEACRLVRAQTKEQKNAVESVLREFFQLVDDGWHQARCDAEIERFQAGEPEREVKKANESNRLKRHRDERAELFKVITEAGQHLPWNVGMNELRDAVKRVSATATETLVPPLPATAPATLATATHTHTHTPDSNTVPNGTDGEPSTAMTKAELWAAGRSLLEAQGLPDAQCRSFMGKLVSEHGEAVVGTAVRAAVAAQPQEVREYLAATCRNVNKAIPETTKAMAEPAPKWATKAGFSDRFEANNAGCFEKTAHQFRDGKRIETTA